jgi:hypothetical protein
MFFEWGSSGSKGGSSSVNSACSSFHGGYRASDESTFIAVRGLCRRDDVR